MFVRMSCNFTKHQQDTLKHMYLDEDDNVGANVRPVKTAKASLTGMFPLGAVKSARPVRSGPQNGKPVG